MFATKKYVDSEVNSVRSMNYIKTQIESISTKWHDDMLWQLKRDYENLLARHQRLLDYLGLHEEDLPAETVIRSKGGPESGNRDER